MFMIYKTDLNCEFTTIVTCSFLLHENVLQLSELKTNISSTFKLEKGSKGIVVNRTSTSLYKGSLEITLTVPLTYRTGGFY